MKEDADEKNLSKKGKKGKKGKKTKEEWEKAMKDHMKQEAKRLEDIDNRDDEEDRVRYRFVDENRHPKAPKEKWPKKPKDDDVRGFGAYPDQIFKPKKIDKTMPK